MGSPKRGAVSESFGAAEAEEEDDEDDEDADEDADDEGEGEGLGAAADLFSKRGSSSATISPWKILTMMSLYKPRARRKNGEPVPCGGVVV